MVTPAASADSLNLFPFGASSQADLSPASMLIVSEIRVFI